MHPFLPLFIINILLLHAASQIHKRRLCVMFEVNKYRKSSGLLTSLNAMDKNRCMMECTRHESCHAFNFALGTGLCELVTEVKGCMAVMESPTFHFVHLGECGTHIPWHTHVPVDGNWQWVIETNLVDWNNTISRSGWNTECVTYILQRYVLAWLVAKRAISNNYATQYKFVLWRSLWRTARNGSPQVQLDCIHIRWQSAHECYSWRLLAWWNTPLYHQGVDPSPTAQWLL